MKQKKKPILIVVIAVLVLLAAISVFCITFILIGFFSDADSALGEEEIAEYNHLAENYAHFTGSFIEQLPLEELNIPVPGVDYDPLEIQAAFDVLYDTPALAEVVRNTENAKYLITPLRRPAEALGPDAWVGLGDIITQEIVEQYSDPGDTLDHAFYDALGDPAVWVGMGDVIVGGAAAGLAEHDEPIAPVFRTDYVVDVISSIAQEAGITEDFGFLEDTITKYIDGQWGGFDAAEFIEYTDIYFDTAWDDYRANPVPANIPAVADAQTPNEQFDKYGRIKAEFFPIQYKALGRLFYRELLSEKQQLAYDIAVTTTQAGLFEIQCNFGISEQEMLVAMKAVKYDFPEFFYLAGFSSDVDVDDNARDLHLGIHNDIKTVGIDSALAQVAAKVSPVVAEARQLSSDIEKVKYITDTICQTTVYPRLNEQGIAPSGKSDWEMQTMWSCIKDGETVCAGYSTTFHYYMKLLGIPATTMTGGRHGWNLLQLDGDYYYMDVTWIDTSENYRWFNFNEELLVQYAAGDKFRIECHTGEGLSALLPAAHGTKYGYEAWFGSLEPPAPPTSTPYVPPTVSATVAINGTDVSSKLKVKDADGVLYAEGKTFVEAFTDPGAPASARWFDYAYSKKDDAVYLSHYISGEQVFTLHLYSEFMEWHSAEGDEDQNISAKVQIFENEVYIPMLAFAENLGKAGYEAEIVLNGETHTFGKQSDATAEPPTSTDPSEPPSGQTEQAWQIPEWSESKALIDDWRDGPVSLEVPMKEFEVTEGLAGTYVGYYKYTPNQIVIVLNEDNATGYCEEIDSGYPADRFTFSLLFDTQHPMFDNMYNGLVLGQCIEEGHTEGYEFVVVSPTILYEPANEAIFYKVD